MAAADLNAGLYASICIPGQVLPHNPNLQATIPKGRRGDMPKSAPKL